jgi:multidrug efflux pump subunit AcrB
VLSGLLVLVRAVPLKMLPFDNKNEFQVVIDLPEGSTLERTAAAAHELAAMLRTVHEVTDVTSYVGTASPMDFNGLVRHYYLRQGPHVADLRVNLVEKRRRTHSSHELTLRLRRELQAIADRYGAALKVVELPPGPPVIATVTVEVHGRPYHDYAQVVAAARAVEERFRLEPALHDVDSTIEAEQEELVFVVDQEKAAIAGLSKERIGRTLAAALGGVDATWLHDESEARPLAVHLRLPRHARSDPAELMSLALTTGDGGMVQLGELGRFVRGSRDQTIYRKNLRPVAYVFGEPVGRTPAEVIFAMQGDLKPGAGRVPEGFEVAWAGEGEWKITVDVFRDLGLAFAAACLGIYILLVYETGSYFMPVVLMISIPLTVIGIMPGFALLNLLFDRPIGGFDNPVFFTATAMIGMIALSGIAVRNAILLIDFIHAAQRRGLDLRQAILDSGAVRFRPIFLTAGTAVLAAIPITLDPIFSGLAWALIFGLFVSTAFTLLVIPVVYWLVYGRTPAQEIGT